MELKKEDICNLEKSCKFSFSDVERAEVLSHMNFWINKFDELVEINVEGVERIVSVAQLSNVLREDISFKMVPRDEILRNAPEQNNGYFQAPKTI